MYMKAGDMFAAPDMDQITNQDHLALVIIIHIHLIKLYIIIKLYIHTNLY